MQQIPFELDAEFRGRQAEGGEFVNNQGEQVVFGPAYRFEYELPDGDVSILSLRENQLDKVADKEVEASKIRKGERFILVGTAHIPDRGSDANAFIRLVSFRRQKAADLKVA